MSRRRFGDVLPVRLPTDVNRRLALLAAAASITKSDALRMAIAHGLPDLEAGRLHLLDSSEGSCKKARSTRKKEAVR